MKRRKWTSETKAQVVLSGVTGQPVAETCNDYGISQSPYYMWRDKPLDETFDTKHFEQNPALHFLTVNHL